MRPRSRYGMTSHLHGPNSTDKITGSPSKVQVCRLRKNTSHTNICRYIEHILIATHTGESGVGEIFRALQNRLRDSTWTVVFKSLITVHLMIREGSPDVTLAYLARHRNMLAISTFSDGRWMQPTPARSLGQHC